MYSTLKINDRISLIQETGVANFMRCNIWFVRGRQADLIIDTGMGLASLRRFIHEHRSQLTDACKPLKAIVTHSHFDHSGCLHEFDCRLGHRAEAEILANPTPANTVYEGAWTRIGIVDTELHPDYSATTYCVTAAPLTGYLDEGDVIDLGDHSYQVLHLPGHSPGSIGLWDPTAKTLFSGDALYDGELLDNLYHSDRDIYLSTLARIEQLDVRVFHAGHYPSFDAARMRELVGDYRAGNNQLIDIESWFDNNSNTVADMFAEQDWSRIPG